ncbi:uncharacterized protein RJT20DRAFT_134150 [Scheffersomyces xylosifermentans]|uniref:uncharacterized protein n=1 Tax=Scheffersomyces xylosifermentans TaxID=1304137 RepID=UPI00315DCC52
MTDIETYEDPILRLVQDPNLNKDRTKYTSVLSLIGGFPVAERRVSRLCSNTFTILQTLEKSNLIFKSWEFLSLDFNSDEHFENKDIHIREFNNKIAEKVVSTCKELNKKISKISNDIDVITRASRSLSPMDYISDSGTLLTSLLLKSIKLKNEVVDSLTVSYSKAKLIIIGKELQIMLDDEDEDSTIVTYKSFIVNLLKQLNQAIDEEDNESKYECLALINDMEKMFDAFKLEKLKEVAFYGPLKSEVEEDPEKEDEDFVDVSKDPHSFGKKHHKHSSHSSSSVRTPRNSSAVASDIEDDFFDDSDIGASSLYSSSITQPPMIHSITKVNEEKNILPRRRESMSSIATSSLLHKTTIAEELPYLMTAFNSAKNFEEDVAHFKEKEEKESPPTKKQDKPTETQTSSESESVTSPTKQFFGHGVHLPDTSLYTGSMVLPKPEEHALTMSASSYIYSNSSLLSKLGIKPQVITADMSANHLSKSARGNRSQTPSKLFIKNERTEDGDGDKENKRLITPLTKANLESHTILKLGPELPFTDLVD